MQQVVSGAGAAAWPGTETGARLCLQPPGQELSCACSRLASNRSSACFVICTSPAVCLRPHHQLHACGLRGLGSWPAERSAALSWRPPPARAGQPNNAFLAGTAAAEAADKQARLIAAIADEQDDEHFIQVGAQAGAAPRWAEVAPSRAEVAPSRAQAEEAAALQPCRGVPASCGQASDTGLGLGYRRSLNP